MTTQVYTTTFKGTVIAQGRKIDPAWTRVRETVNGPIQYTQTLVDSVKVVDAWSGWEKSYEYVFTKWIDSKGYRRCAFTNRQFIMFDIENNEMYYKINELTNNENDFTGYNYNFVNQPSVFQRLILITKCFNKHTPVNQLFHQYWDMTEFTNQIILRQRSMRNIFGMCSEMAVQIKKKSFRNVVYISKI
ncbi:hypothetical protein FACS189472_12990 [Alphaproteobacteria bacterium]|nr:hypothetical protein FACS189472_12990 [Alphaproteobacteria bacterium]